MDFLLQDRLLEIILLSLPLKDMYNTSKTCRKILEISRRTKFREFYRIKHRLMVPRFCRDEGTMLGDGHAGTAYRYGSIAIKTVNMSSQKTYKEGMNEVDVYTKCSSPYLLRYLDSYKSNNNLCIVLELGEMDLRSYTEKSPLKQDLSTLKIFENVCMAIRYLHILDFAYRDVKPENIIKVGEDFKLGDFGFTKRERYFDEMKGTFDFMSPEMVLLYRGIFKGCYGKPADIWALSVTLYDMIYRKTPFQDESTKKTMKNIIGKPPVYDESLSPAIKTFLDEMLIKEPPERPTIFGLLEKLAILKNSFVDLSV